MIRDGIKILGFSRVQIEDPGGKIVGDSGWVGPNQVVNLGIQDYIVKSIGGSAGSKTISHLAIGTGSAPASDGTDLQGEQSKRKGVTFTIVASRTAQFCATFGSSDAFVTATKNISNIALFNTSAVTVGTLIAGNVFASSSCATNQNVNTTYQLRFAGA